ncbi:MAG TPA: MFS transporter [Aliicoccus persicus]|uniref:MFS transporter n=1 Tax=Aliicoccus persicus TaxID=930138 RepID=A0A921DXN1_9STAP|nr:MFS transporter [Aliicoccus persicus]
MKQLNQKLLLIMIIQFLIYFGFSMVIPVVPELVTELGVSTVHVGWLLATYSIAGFIVAPLFGRLSDKYGRRPILLGGLIVFALSFLFFGLYIDNLVIMYIARVFGGIASGALYTATTSMVADISSREERTRYMGLIGMSIGLGFIFGPGVGGILGDINLSFAFYMTAAVLAGAFVFALIKIEETYKPSTENPVSQLRIVPSEYFLKPVGILLITTFVIMFTMSGMESTFQLLTIELISITPTQMGILFLIGGLLNAAVQGGYIRTLKPHQEYPVMIAGQMMTIIAFIMLPFVPNLWFAGIALILLMLGNALARTLLTSLITREAEDHEMGRMTSTTYALDSLGRILGPLTFNLLFVVYLGLPFWLGALITILSTFFIYQYFRKRGAIA